MKDEAQKCSYVQLFPFENGRIFQNGGFHATAAVPIVGVHIHRGIVCSCSVFNTRSPPHFVPLQLHGSGASGPLWGQQWALGRKSWDTARLAQNQEVSPSVFLLRLLYCWVLGFFVFSFFFFFLNEDLLFETYWKNCYRLVLFPINRLHCNTCWRRVLR